MVAIIAFLGYGFVNFMFKLGERLGASIPVVTTSLYVVAAILSFLWFLYRGQVAVGGIDLKSLAIGSAIAVFSVIGVVAIQEAFKMGPASLIAPLVALNSLIVIVASLFVFREVITLKQCIGIIFALFAAILITSR